MYLEMLDGLRSHYEKRLGGRRSAGYQAAMSLSFLFGISAAAVLIIVDAYVNRGLPSIMWLYDHVALVVMFGILTAWAHVQYAKYHNVYNKTGAPMSNSWKPWFVGYCVVAALLSVAALWMTYLVRPQA